MRTLIVIWGDCRAAGVGRMRPAARNDTDVIVREHLKQQSGILISSATEGRAGLVVGRDRDRGNPDAGERIG